MSYIFPHLARPPHRYQRGPSRSFVATVSDTVIKRKKDNTATSTSIVLVDQGDHVVRSEGSQTENLAPRDTTCPCYFLLVLEHRAYQKRYMDVLSRIHPYRKKGGDTGSSGIACYLCCRACLLVIHQLRLVWQSVLLMPRRKRCIFGSSTSLTQ